MRHTVGQYPCGRAGSYDNTYRYRWACSGVVSSSTVWSGSRFGGATKAHPKDAPVLGTGGQKRNTLPSHLCVEGRIHYYGRELPLIRSMCKFIRTFAVQKERDGDVPRRTPAHPAR